MVFDFLAVEAVGDAAAVLVRQADGSGGDQGDTFVCRTIEHVEVNAGVQNRLGIVTAQSLQGFARIEQPRIEEVWAHATGFQHEFTETKHAGADCEVQELDLILFHGVSMPGFPLTAVSLAGSGDGGQGLRGVAALGSGRLVGPGYNPRACCSRAGAYGLLNTPCVLSL